MKKFVKVSLITAGILFALGCLLGMISAVGGRHQLIHIVREEADLDGKVEAFADALGNAVFEMTDGEWGKESTNGTDGQLLINGEGVTVGSADWYHVEAAAVSSLEIDLGAGTCTIEEKEDADGRIDIYFEGIGTCDYYIEESTLCLEGFKDINILRNNGGLNKITIKIPKDSRFEGVDAEIGAGIMTIESLKVKKLEAAIGAGELEISQLKTEEFSAEIGAGKLDISDMEAQNAELSISMGDCNLKGSITGNLEAECDMGNLEIHLAGKEEDHNYQVECAAGNIEIGNMEISALAAERSVDNNAESSFDISCNMGNITIKFED